MRITFGEEHLDLNLDDLRRIRVERHAIAPALGDVRAALRTALESPVDYPALRRGLTPDDHLAIIVDERLPRLGELLTGLLEHIALAQVAPAAITLLCAPSASRQTWIDALPDEFADVQVEVHDPANRKKLSYLATTKGGRRIYLNRTLVDADQLIVLSRRDFGGHAGYTGGAAAIFPAFSDEPTRNELLTRPTDGSPTTEEPAVMTEAIETAWLLGAPFFIHVIEGEGDTVCHIVAGVVNTSSVSEQLLDDRWRVTVDRPADLVVAALSGDPTRHSFADLARAWASASRVVKPGGRIVLLSRTSPDLTEGAQLLMQAEEPHNALATLRKHTPIDALAAWQWAQAATQAKLSLLSGLPDETAEALFTTPLEDASQVLRLAAGCDSCLVLQDAHKCLTVLRDG